MTVKSDVCSSYEAPLALENRPFLGPSTGPENLKIYEKLFFTCIVLFIHIIVHIRVHNDGKK